MSILDDLHTGTQCGADYRQQLQDGFQPTM